MSFFAVLAERKIEEALRRGELDNLALKGRPIPIEDLSDVPEELRMAFKILKNAGVLPEELQLHREIVTLKDLLHSCQDEEEQRETRRRLNEKILHFNILQEKNAGRAAFRRYAGRIEERLGISGGD